MDQLSRNKDIAEFAEDISSFYFQNSLVEPSLIAKNKGISYSSGSYSDGFDALLIYSKNRFHIQLNIQRLSTLTSPRARFSMSHELGHFFIDEHRMSLLNGESLFHISTSEYQSELLVEQEADLFASHLLMPTERLVRSAKKTKPGFEGILHLSNVFGTSITCCSLKYVESEFRPALLIKWDKDGRLQWKKYSMSFYEARLSLGVKKGWRFNHFIPGSATDKIHSGLRPSEAAFFRTGATVRSWFPTAHKFHDDILIEEAIPLGPFGSLTILYTDKGKL